MYIISYVIYYAGFAGVGEVPGQKTTDFQRVLADNFYRSMQRMLFQCVRWNISCCCCLSQQLQVSLASMPLHHLAKVSLINFK